MGMRFRKSMKIGGARVSLSKSGVGTSFGVKGARYSVHSSGRRTTSVGIPGSGLSYVSSSGNRSGQGSRSSSSNNELTPYQQQRLSERHASKIQLATERRGKALNKLKETYAAGKISKEEYTKLAKRDKEITLDLMIFGRGTGVKLAERYVLGKIESEQYESLKNEVLGKPEVEKDYIIDNYKTTARAVSDFVENAQSSTSNQNCSNCGKEKRFFSPLHNVSSFMLCGSCRKHYNELRKYPGYDGQYYTSESSIIDPDVENFLVLNIRSQHVLQYR